MLHAMKHKDVACNEALVRGQVSCAIHCCKLSRMDVPFAISFLGMLQNNFERKYSTKLLRN